jgi:hypothetical protein
MKIRHDIFPASILVASPDVFKDFTLASTSSSLTNPTGARSFTRVRLVVMEDANSSTPPTQVVLVAADHPDGPRLVFREVIRTLNWSGNKRQDSQLITESGKVIAFKYVRGCDCGSRLRSWSPYQIMKEEIT